MNERVLSVESADVDKKSGPSRSWIQDCISIARPDHWFKNVFMLPGAALAIILSDNYSWEAVLALLRGILSVCLIASANYTINEWLDAPFDRHHPVKRHRPSAAGRVDAKTAYIQWALLSVLGLAVGWTISPTFAITAAALLVMGLIYNVQPVRAKDRPYLDVLTESINNPLRFMLGWTAIVSVAMPPASILLAYWMGGAYLMAVKRYAEYRSIGDPAVAGRYRRSFQYYTEATLLVSSFFYALSSSFFLGVFLIKYRIEFLVSMPFLALLFTWYLWIGLRAHSPAQAPEKLYQERFFMLYLAALVALIVVLFFVDLPWLNVLVEHHAMSTH